MTSTAAERTAVAEAIKQVNQLVAKAAFTNPEHADAAWRATAGVFLTELGLRGYRLHPLGTTVVEVDMPFSMTLGEWLERIRAVAATPLTAAAATHPTVDDQQEAHEFGEWCIVELFGHRRVAGHVREVTIAGAGFLRLDVPAVVDGRPRTQYFHPSAVYGLHPCSEGTAREAAERFRHDPVSRWELPAARPVPAGGDLSAEFDEVDDDDDGAWTGEDLGADGRLT